MIILVFNVFPSCFHNLFHFWYISLFWWRIGIWRNLSEGSLCPLRILSRETDPVRVWLGNLFSAPPAAFLKMWNHSMDMKTQCVSRSSEITFLPKACVIPCWEKPGEKENVISDCLWAMVWENEQCSSSQWTRLAGSELGRSHRAGRAWGATSTDGLSTAGPRDAVSDASCSALHTSRCYGQAGSQAGLHS